MNTKAAQTMPTVPQAFFDEFGVNADDRVMDYGRACYAAALSQTAGVPDGWKLVPVEPTEVMCEAAMSSLGWTRSEAAAKTAPITPASPMMEGSMKVWSAMLAAAPAASGGEGTVDVDDDAGYLDAVADVLESIGKVVMARVVRVIAAHIRDLAPNPSSDASVSERARELRERAEAHGGGVFVSVGDIRAIEQALTQPSDAERERDLLAEAIGNAGVKCGLLRKDIEGLTGPQLLMVCDDMAEALTQQRGEVAWKHDAESWGNALNEAAWVFVDQCPEKSALLFNNTKAPLRAAILKYAELVRAATPPQPSADAVRELVSKMYGGAVAVGSDGQWVSVRRYLLDELESLLSAATDHQQNAAQGGGEK